MPAPLIVPDASVLLKWTLDSDDEEDREKALVLKESWLSGLCRVVVPTLWLYELGNILGLKRPAVAGELLQTMVDLEFEERTPTAYLKGILRLMNAHKVTFYDAAYHAIAISEGGTFLTADAAYVKKTIRAGHVQTLKGWRAPHHDPTE